MQRHRHQEFIRFLNAVEKTVPAAKAMHVILDNYSAHKHPKVIAWLARHPRVTFHFTPTDGMLMAAARALADTSPARSNAEDNLLPPVAELCDVSMICFVDLGVR